MIKITTSQLKSGLGKYLDLALIEGEIYISRHNRIIAKIVAIKDAKTDSKA